MKPYQLQVVEDKKELDTKIDKLRARLDDPIKFDQVDEDEQDFLFDQIEVMIQYSEVLGDRIALFAAMEAKNESR